MNRSSKALLALAVAGAACSSTPTRESPQARDGSVPGWFLSGPRMQAFRIGVDREVHFGGGASGRLASTEKGSGAGTIMQSVSADAYRGKRMRFSAVVRTRDLDGWTGLWMRIDRPDRRPAFDNMQQRPLRGTTEWTRVEVVLDVALDATAIQLGLLQDGNGTSWIDEASLEPVGKEVAVTAIDPYSRAFANIDFESPDEPGQSPDPKGWLVQGMAHDDFRAERDTSEKHGGTASAKLVNKVDAPRGEGMLAQTIRADDYAGTRVRVSAWLKARDVERGGSFTVTSYAGDAGPLSPGLTKASCGLGRTLEWELCEGVLDIPVIADTMQVSLGLQGKGTAWMDDVRVVPVGLDVPLTEVDRRASALRNGNLEQAGKSPEAWYLAGGARAHYEAVVDTIEKHGGKQSARLEPRVKDPRGYGTMMQTFRAHDFRGKRLRMNAFVKGKGIDGRGDLWMRVQAADSPADGAGLGAGRCVLTGTFDWKPCTVVFDVPERGDEIDVGIGLDAHGTIWLDDVTFEPVDATVPLTTKSIHRRTLDDGGFEGAVDAPSGWFMSGGARKEFKLTVDRTEHAEGTTSIRFEPAVPKPSGYGTMMTSILAESYRGKRLRMTSRVRGRGITARGDMWLRVQALGSPGDGPGLGGGSCDLAGDFEWRPCTVVFDVPERGMWIELGIGLAGPGTVWLDDVRLEEVAKDAPVTGVVRDKTAPENLNFER
jgi:hypothetical protein